MKEQFETKEKELEDKVAALTRERDGLKKENDEQKAKEAERRKEEEERKRYIPITSLSDVRVYMPLTDGIKCEGNSIIHHGKDRTCRNVVIGNAMIAVCFYLSHFEDSCLFLLLIGNLSHVCILV